MKRLLAQCSNHVGYKYFYRVPDTDFDPNKYFKLKKGTTDWTIIVENAIDNNVLKKKKYLTMTVEANLNGAKSYASLVISLPEEDDTKLVAFDQILYTGVYENETLSYKLIKIVTELADKDVKIQIKDSEYAHLIIKFK